MFLPTLRPRNSKKHQFLIQEGDNVINDYFVVKGLLKAYHVDKELGILYIQLRSRKIYEINKKGKLEE